MSKHEVINPYETLRLIHDYLSTGDIIYALRCSVALYWETKEYGTVDDWDIEASTEAFVREHWKTITSTDQSRLHTCQNCNWIGYAPLEEIPDFYERVDGPNSVQPSGECPKCRCLSYLVSDLDC